LCGGPKGGPVIRQGSPIGPGPWPGLLVGLLGSADSKGRAGGLFLGGDQGRGKGQGAAFGFGNCAGFGIPGPEKGPPDSKGTKGKGGLGFLIGPPGWGFTGTF